MARRGWDDGLAAAGGDRRTASRSVDAQLRRDARLSHFGYFELATLSEAPELTLAARVASESWFG
jgi:hypothetical protein